MKKIISAIITVVMSISLLIGSTATADSDIRVTLNGTQIQFDSAPVIQNGRTLVPIRAIFEAMGMSVSWDNNTKKILAFGDNGVITMEIGTVMLGYGSSEGNIELHPMDVAPTIINDRTYVPARYVAEATGYDVNWDGATRTVSITGSPRSAESSEDDNDWTYPEYEVKGSFEFYNDYPDVLDYGKLNNVTCKEEYLALSGYTYVYPGTSQDMANYILAIKSLGFEMDMEPLKMFGISMFYSKGNTSITISYADYSQECKVAISQS